MSDRGLSIPDDISVLGVSDNDWVDHLRPGLTHVSVDTLKISKIALDMLSRRMQEPLSAANEHLVPLKFERRGSCGPAKKRKGG